MPRLRKITSSDLLNSVYLEGVGERLLAGCLPSEVNKLQNRSMPFIPKRKILDTELK